MCQEPSQRFHYPKNPSYCALYEGRNEACAAPGGREEGEAGHLSFTACALSRHNNLLFTMPFLLHVAALPPKPKFPRLNRINIPMAKERCVPQRRCNHVVPAEATQAYEIEHWAERLNSSSGQPLLPRTSQLYPARNRRSPGRGTGFNLASLRQATSFSGSLLPRSITRCRACFRKCGELGRCEKQCLFCSPTP